MNWYCPTCDDTIVYLGACFVNNITHLHRLYVSLVWGGTNAMNIGWLFKFNPEVGGI